MIRRLLRLLRGAPFDHVHVAHKAHDAHIHVGAARWDELRRRMREQPLH